VEYEPEGEGATTNEIEFEDETAIEPEAETEACPKICPTMERVKSTAKRNLPVIPIFVFECSL